MGFALVYLAVASSYRRLGYNNAVNGQWQPHVMGLLFVLAIAIPLYLSRKYLLPTLLYQQKNRKFILLFFITLFTSALLVFVAGYFVLNNGTKEFRWLYFEPVNITFNVLFFIAFPTVTALGFKILGDQIKTKVAYEQALKEKKQAELDYLKSQLNPHFLFNAINTMYFQVDESVADAKKTMVQFSEMLRYQLYECSTEFIAIEKEITCLNNYIALQLLRKDANYQVKFAHDGVENFEVPPLLLIPLVENAFKYLSNYEDRTNNINIRMTNNGMLFDFVISNTTESNNINSALDLSGGIGISNVKKRLELLYPVKHSFTVIEKENLFTVKLQFEHG